jgi:uncharacterized protein (TIGR02145 family)
MHKFTLLTSLAVVLLLLASCGEHSWESLYSELFEPSSSSYDKASSSSSAGIPYSSSGETPGATELCGTILYNQSTQLCDSRDLQVYKKVKIDHIFWMAENLNYETASGSRCLNNQASYCNMYGRLYNWDATEDACPPGWQMPSSRDWTELALLGNSFEHLKATSGWSNGNGSDIYGFAALPGGVNTRNPDYAEATGSFGGWWTGIDNSTNMAEGIWIDESNRPFVPDYYGNYIISGSNYKSDFYSVRCRQRDYSFPSCSNDTLYSSSSSFTDCRDGKIYKTVRIGSRIWMAENLNYETVIGSLCYNNQASYCNVYGRLYDWEAAMEVCPPGWHLPSKEDWEALGDNANLLKATSGWENNGSGQDTYRFAALPGGCAGNSCGSSFFGERGIRGYWWSTYESHREHANCRSMNWLDYAYWNTGYKGVFYSVRCIKD